MKKYRLIIITGFFTLAIFTLLVLFAPDFIKTTLLSNLLKNDNLNNFLTLANIFLTTMMFILQGIETEKEKEMILKYSSVLSQYKPGVDTIYNYAPLVSTLLSPPPNEEHSSFFVSAYHDVCIDKSLVIPVQATIQSKKNIESISFSDLNISYTVNNEVQALQIPELLTGEFLHINKIYGNGSKVLLYFTLYLNNEQYAALCNSRISISFEQKLTSTDKDTEKKNVTLVLLKADDAIHLIEQS